MLKYILIIKRIYRVVLLYILIIEVNQFRCVIIEARSQPQKLKLLKFNKINSNLLNIIPNYNVDDVDILVHETNNVMQIL